MRIHDPHSNRPVTVPVADWAPAGKPAMKTASSAADAASATTSRGTIEHLLLRRTFGARSTFRHRRAHPSLEQVRDGREPLGARRRPFRAREPGDVLGAIGEAERVERQPCFVVEELCELRWQLDLARSRIELD